MEMGKHVILVAMENVIRAKDCINTICCALGNDLGIAAAYRDDKLATLETPNCIIRFVWPAVKYNLDGIRPDAVFGYSGYIAVLNLEKLYTHAKYPARDHGIGLLNYIKDVERYGSVVHGYKLETYFTNDVDMTKAVIKNIHKENNAMPHIPPIKNVIFNNPATIVFWADNTKTVVKCENEEFDPEKGLAMAISKKALGNQGNYFNEFKKWTKPYYDAILADMDRGVD